MKILGLWVVQYVSGSNSDYFEKALQALGHEVDIVPISSTPCDMELLKKIKEKKYDLLFHVPYGNNPRPEVIQHITRNTDILTLAWNGDDEWLWFDPGPMNTGKIANNYSYCVTTDPAAVKKYHDAGQKNVILAQWGWGEEWTPKKVNKDIDVYFCGQLNDTRREYLKALIKLGVEIVADGHGLGGKIPFKEMVNRYRRSKIALNFVTGNRGNFIYQQVKCRNFEVPALGTFLLTEWCPALGKHFKFGEEMMGFKDAEECASKIKYFLKHDAYRERMAKLGQFRNREYSMKKILKTALEKIK